MSAPGCARGDELDAALDGRLGADAAREVLAHAARCAGCEARRRERALRREALDALPDAAPAYTRGPPAVAPKARGHPSRARSRS